MIFYRYIRQAFLLLMISIALMKTDEVTWYRTFLNEQVAPAYLNGYQTLKNRIISPLLTYNNDQEILRNETEINGIVTLVQGLTCATKELYMSLSSALNASEQLNTAVENKLSALILLISQNENAIREVNTQLSTIEAQLADTQAKVTEAENEVRTKENELAQADANLAEEQRKLDKARECGLRKKRFIGSILKPIVRPFKPILKPICAVLNYGGIDSAKDRRGAAQGAVNAARENLANRQQELQRIRSEYTNLQAQQAQANAQLKSLSDDLAQLQTRQVTLANMITELRTVLQHLELFYSKSSVLYDELQNLVSFEFLIEPLNGILTELISNGISTDTIVSVTQIPSTEIETIQRTIELVKTQLPTLPVNEGNSYTC